MPYTVDVTSIAGHDIQKALMQEAYELRKILGRQKRSGTLMDYSGFEKKFFRPQGITSAEATLFAFGETVPGGPTLVYHQLNPRTLVGPEEELVIVEEEPSIFSIKSKTNGYFQQLPSEQWFLPFYQFLQQNPDSVITRLDTPDEKGPKRASIRYRSLSPRTEYLPDLWWAVGKYFYK